MVRLYDHRRGQITVFVIIAFVLMGGIVFLFLIDNTPSVSRGQDLDNPEHYVDSCIKDHAITTIDTLLQHGGFPESSDTVLYQGNEITYVCKNVNFYQPCIVQYPLYITQMQEALNHALREGVEACFASLESSLVQKNYIIDAGTITLQTSIKPDITHITISRPFIITKSDTSRSYDRFDIFIATPLYDLASLAGEIIAQEAQWCYFSNDGFMLLYPQFDVQKDVLGESTKIYTITDKSTKKQLTMAIRGCAIPAGF